MGTVYISSIIKKKDKNPLKTVHTELPSDLLETPQKASKNSKNCFGAKWWKSGVWGKEKSDGIVKNRLLNTCGKRREGERGSLEQNEITLISIGST